MLVNRISLRVATAVGSAAMVAGATFAVSAFADSGPAPEQAAATATAPPAEDAPFFEEGEGLSEEELATLMEEGEEQRSQARADAGASAGSSLEGQEEEEEEEEEESEDNGSSGGGSAPTGSNREIAQAMLGDFGWGDDQWSCLDSLWERESNWDHTAQNPSSGAYGIPQALPGEKMASAGSDWQTNPATQIEWGLGYIQDRYGSPCQAWSHSEANGWY